MLTESERRGVLLVAALLALGAGYDLWRAHAVPRAAEVGVVEGAADRDAAAPARRMPAADAPVRGSDPIDLNRADAAQLERLPGIGPTLADRIVAHRGVHGPFRAVDELLAVRGIGPRLLERIAPHLAIRPADDRPGAGSPGTGDRPAP